MEGNTKMLLFREVYGWLRYLVNKDPTCNKYGIVAEEIHSTTSHYDVDDGIRTIAIHRVSDGLTPRIEYRSVSLYPQVYWYNDDISHGILLNTVRQYGFPGDFKAWNCSELCHYLLRITKEKLCCPAEVDANVEVTAKKIIDLTIVKRILEAVERSSNKGTKLTGTMVNDWLKKNEKTDLMDFALSVLHWFDKGKVDWNEIKYLENDEAPGKDIIDWSWLKRNLNTPERLSKLTPPVVERVTASCSSSLAPVHVVQARLENMLQHFIRGKNIEHVLTVDVPHFGASVIAHFKSGSIPFYYLKQLELCDPLESVLPWSFIRRSVLSYSQATAETANDLVELVIEWLKGSNLLLLLYNEEKSQEESLVKVLKAQITHYIKQTLSNEFWMKALLNTLSSKNSTEMKRGLQVEFDLWLLDALAPAIKQWNLPLSPYSLSIEKKDLTAYTKIYKSWEDSVKKYIEQARIDSGKRLTDSISNFYTQLVMLWKTEELQNYKAKIPSATRILDAVSHDNKMGLLSILCEDFEDEVGSKIPDEIKIKLLSSPYFNTINREVKLQGMIEIL